MRRSDDFSARTIRSIAERSGNVCAFPNCRAPTFGPAEGGGSVNIGVAAHIAAASPGGPRFDAGMTSAQRRAPENGIWLCSTHATLVDRDVAQFTAELLHNWKWDAEYRATKTIGQPRGCAAGRIASVSPAVRLGADYSVRVNGQPIPHIPIFDADDGHSRITSFVTGLVIQFSIQKNQNRKNVVLDHLTVTVHETKDIPEYQQLFLVYPAEVSLFYVEIDKNLPGYPREFRPTRYYEKASGETPETAKFPAPIVLDDVPAQVAIRFNAKTPAMYLISLDAAVSSGEDRETLPIMPPQWVICELPEPYSEQ